MNLDEALRTALRERAETYRPGPGLMDAVRGRRRQHRRRQIVAAAALAVAVAIAAPVAAVALRWLPRPTVAPVLVMPAAAPSFPVTPGWEPDWVGLRSFTYQRSATGFSEVLRYEPTSPFRAELAVVVSDQPPSLIGESVQVGEHSATLATANGHTSLAWPLGAAWVRVEVNDRVSRDELILFAASLIDRPLPMAMPFSLTAIPESAELVAFDRYTMVYRRAPSDAALITVSMVSLKAVPRSTVDGLAVVVDAASITTYRKVDSDRAVRVQATAGWDVTEAQMASIALGVDITAVALTSGG
jgi:hypothetical protein